MVLEAFKSVGWPIVIFGLILAGAGAFIIKRARDEESTLYRIQRAPPVQLEDATDGVPIKAYGKIICNEKYAAPYSGKECVWSRSVKEVYVETTDSKGRKSGRWETVEDRVKSVPFLLDDETGKIAINLQDAPLDYIDGQKVFEWSGYEGRKTKKTEWAIPPESAFIYGMAFKEGNTIVVMKSTAEPIVASFRPEKDFIAFKRSDDLFANISGYGLLLLGIGIMGWYFAG